MDNYRLAIEKLTDSPSRRPRSSESCPIEYLVAAYGTDKLNDFAKAEAAAKELIAVEPDEPGNYQALARLYEDQGRYDDAEAMFRKATEVKPNEPGGYQILAGFYNRQGEFDKTMEAFQKRAQMEPNNPEAWHTMATYYFDKASRDKRLTPAQEKTTFKAASRRRTRRSPSTRITTRRSPTRASCSRSRPTSKRTRQAEGLSEAGRFTSPAGARPAEETGIGQGGRRRGKEVIARPRRVQTAKGRFPKGSAPFYLGIWGFADLGIW